MNVAQWYTQLAPELILLVGACATLLLGATRVAVRRSWVSAFAAIVVVLALIATVWLGVPDGTRAAIGLWLTSLTFYTRLIGLGIGLLIILVNWHQPVAEERGEYLAMILFSLLGVVLTASANDLIVLFFAIELVSVPTYVLIALSRLDQRATESAVKYFFLGALSAAILAYGLSFLYGVAGTTLIHTVTEGVARSTFPSGGEMSGQAVIGLLLVLGGLAFKIAAVPFHAYVPDVYEGAASPVTGMLGFVPKFAGFVALVKIFTACNWDLPATICWTIWCLAAVTMTFGNVLALLQKNVKRMLAYSSIAHTGYMLIAVLVGPVAGDGPTHDGVAALFFYIAIYGAMNLGAFAMLAAFKSAGREVETIADLGGIAGRAPLATLGLAVCTFSLMGLPPTAGFVGKLYILSCAFSLEASHPFHLPLIALAIIAVLNTAIGAGYYLRLVAAAYFGAESTEAVPSGGAPVRWGLGLCSIVVLLFFVWPNGLTAQARKASLPLREAIRSGSSKLTAVYDPTHEKLSADTQPPSQVYVGDSSTH